MRQAGVLAATAIYALEHQVEQLATDHLHAARLSQGIAAVDGLGLSPPDMPTNMVYVDVDPALGTAQEVAEALTERGVRVLAAGPQRLRAVVHRDVSADGIDRAISAFQEVAAEQREGVATDC